MFLAQHHNLEGIITIRVKNHQRKMLGFRQKLLKLKHAFFKPESDQKGRGETSKMGELIAYQNKEVNFTNGATMR